MKKNLLTVLSIIFLLVIIINPNTNLDIGLTILFLAIAGHIIFKEKLLLAFLLIRPTLDHWNYIEIFRYKTYIINLNAVLAILFFLWLGFMLIKNYKAIPKKLVYLLFAILAFLMLLSSFYSVSTIATLIETIKFINLAMIFALSYVFIKQNKITTSQLLKTILLSAIIPILFGVYQLVLGKGISTFGIHGRIYGTFAHPNVFAFFVLFLLFLHIQFSSISPTLFWQKNKKFRIAVYIFLLFLILMTYTRAALVGLAVFLLIIGILKYRKMLAGVILSIILASAIFVPINFWLKTNTNYDLQRTSIIQRLTTRDEDSDSIAWRQALIRESMPIIGSRPLLGFGYGTFPLVWEENRGSSHQWDDSAEAHNDYLRLGLEIGLLGLMLYLILLGTLFFNSAKLVLNKSLQKKNLYIFAWIGAFIILSLSDNMLHHTAVMWLMWSWLGASLVPNS